MTQISPWNVDQPLNSTFGEGKQEQWRIKKEESEMHRRYKNRQCQNNFNSKRETIISRLRNRKQAVKNSYLFSPITLNQRSEMVRRSNSSQCQQIVMNFSIKKDNGRQASSQSRDERKCKYLNHRKQCSTINEEVEKRRQLINICSVMEVKGEDTFRRPNYVMKGTLSKSLTEDKYRKQYEHSPKNNAINKRDSYIQELSLLLQHRRRLTNIKVQLSYENKHNRHIEMEKRKFLPRLQTVNQIKLLFTDQK